LIPLEERQQVVALIQEAMAAGARQRLACETLGLSVRTYQRWVKAGVIRDGRQTAQRTAPANKLSHAERQRILAVCNSPAYAQLPPYQIVPRLADQGQYLGSESTFYRVLRAANQWKRRGTILVGPKTRPVRHFVAAQPNRVWSWDITYCPSRLIGQHYYLYMIEDIYSRKVVGWEVYDQENGDYAAALVERSVWKERCTRNQLVLHSDNGSPMKSLTLRAKLQELGVENSYSRPRVSNDNPFSESLFRTVKYHPRWPSEGFASLQAARGWVKDFVHWYNHEHRHSRIKFVTPAQRHQGEDIDILKKRDVLYAQMKRHHPERWSASTRNWKHEPVVELNPKHHKDPKVA
jgi:transposase InsO family protein